VLECHAYTTRNLTFANPPNEHETRRSIRAPKPRQALQERRRRNPPRDSGSAISSSRHFECVIPYRKMLERHAELLEPLNGALTLDAGTGTGNVAELLVARGATVTGIDFCEPALEKCRWKVRQAEFHFGDLTQPPRVYTGVLRSRCPAPVLHLLRPSAQQLAVDEFFRVLKPGEWR